MKRIILAALIAISAITMTGCIEEAPPSNKKTQSAKAKEAANSIVFAENAEIDNIKKRLELTSSPSQLGYIVLLNQAGQPIMYTNVKGKVTSGSKRLTEPDRCSSNGQGGCVSRPAASDEGTYGSSDPYIYFWTQNGQYVQWNGGYLYSDKPIRLRVEPLVVNVVDQK